MKYTFVVLLVPLVAVSLLTGCGKSERVAPSVDDSSASSTAAQPGVAPASAPAVKVAAEAVRTVAADLASQFMQKAGAEKDALLGSIAGDLVGKVKSLGAAAGANEAVKAQLDSTLQSLLGGMDAAALGTAFKVVEAAKLTPEQIGLAKEVGNLASAFVVQRNFAALDGAQGDVATIVNSLRKGEVMAAVPAIQKVAQNTHLTVAQKDLMGSLVNQYAPGLKKAADSVQQGLQGIKSLPGLNK